MFHVILYEPEIPPNTGNIIRLCANTATHLHLIHPLGFSLEERRLRRAGLDYREWAQVREHDTLSACLAQIGGTPWAFTTRAKRPYTDAAFSPGDALLFGPETRGLPGEVLAGLAPDRLLRVPMVADSRSLNMSNAVAVAVYEAWRQNSFAGSR